MKITNFTCSGKCSNCGECCTDLLPLSNTEIKRIKQYVKKNNIKPTAKSVMAYIDLTCPFRDNKNKICKIYEVRPDICRAFKCDLDLETIERRKQLYNANRYLVSMRKTFFGEQSDLEKLEKLKKKEK